MTSISEDYLQSCLSRWLTSRGVMHFHVPNGGYRNKREASKLKGMGVKAGVPDLVLLFQNGTTVFVELKVKGSLSVGQKKFHEDLENLNHSVYTIKTESTADGIAELEKIIEIYNQ